MLRGWHLLGKLGSANHHPQKRHLPRQAGRAQAVVLWQVLIINNLLILRKRGHGFYGLDTDFKKRFNVDLKSNVKQKV